MGHLELHCLCILGRMKNLSGLGSACMRNCLVLSSVTFCSRLMKNCTHVWMLDVTHNVGVESSAELSIGKLS